MLLNTTIVRINCYMCLKLYFRASSFSFQASRLQPSPISVYMAGLMSENAGGKNYMLMVSEP